MRNYFTSKLQSIRIDHKERWLEVEYIDIPRESYYHDGSKRTYIYYLYLAADVEKGLKIEVEYHDFPEEYIYDFNCRERYPVVIDALPTSFKNDVTVWLDIQLSLISMSNDLRLYEVLQTFKKRIEVLK